MPAQSTQDLEQLYRDWSPVSASLNEAAKKVMPGGDTRASAWFAPYPLAMTHGEGCQIFDEDDHTLIDFMNNFTSLIHGHAFAPVVRAVTNQIARGSAFAALTRSQTDLAELLVARVPSIETMRFCSSGTEATLMALRCARAVTGRDKIMKMEGGYHGSYELAEVSLVPLPHLAGQADRPVALPVDASIPQSALDDAVITPLNAAETATRLIEANASDLAAVIVEPMLGSMGMVPATREYLQVLRDVTTKHGILLIFDEVITLRASEGGMQKILGVTPDLTAMGKIIGGGLPAGGIGGRAELMDVFNPERDDAVMHASTFSGNPLTMAAGLAAMSAFDEAQATRINGLGERLRKGITRVFKDAGIKGHGSGTASLVNVLFTDEAVDNARASLGSMIEAGHITNAFHLGLLRRGIMTASRLMMAVSTPMSEVEIDAAIAAVADTLSELKPVIAAERPSLLV
jgi:glutamate-1-semialdehyde 2,1-aminomutase